MLSAKADKEERIMSMFVKKKQILAATLIVALAAAVTVNWYYSKPKAQTDEKTTTSQQQEANGSLGDSLLVGANHVNEQNKESEATLNAGEYFASSKLEQSKANDEAKKEIEKILENEKLSDGDKTKIETLLSKYSENLKTQTDCELLIKAKLGGECVVIINKEKAQVIIENGKSNETSILQITEIIENNTNISAENLTIIEAK